MILDKLALHLNSYYIKNEIDNENIVEITRKEMDSNILKNRVLDTITKDMNERPAFNHYNGEDMGNIISATGKNGIIYSRLNIALPPKSKIIRNDNNFLEISNKIFDITIVPNYQGVNDFLDPILVDNNSIDEYGPLYSANFILIINLKRLILFNNDYVILYGWLDSFLDEIEEFISIKCLNKRLNPNFLKSLLDIINKSKVSKNNKKPKEGYVMKMMQVYSSNIAAVGYDASSQILHVEFLNSELYEYRDVPIHIYQGLMNASSPGKYFFDNIRNIYSYRKLK